jgi:hypothetical protein
MPSIDPLLALGVVVSTMATDAVYVLFNAAVSGRRRFGAATWSSIWYLLSAFAVISYTKNPIYTLFAATGSWIGAFCAVSWLNRTDLQTSLSPRRIGVPQARSSEPPAPL